MDNYFDVPTVQAYVGHAIQSTPTFARLWKSADILGHTLGIPQVDIGTAKALDIEIRGYYDELKEYSRRGGWGSGGWAQEALTFEGEFKVKDTRKRLTENWLVNHIRRSDLSRRLVTLVTESKSKFPGKDDLFRKINGTSGFALGIACASNGEYRLAKEFLSSTLYAIDDGSTGKGYVSGDLEDAITAEAGHNLEAFYEELGLPQRCSIIEVYKNIERRAKSERNGSISEFEGVEGSPREQIALAMHGEEYLLAARMRDAITNQVDSELIGLGATKQEHFLAREIGTMLDEKIPEISKDRSGKFIVSTIKGPVGISVNEDCMPSISCDSELEPLVRSILHSRRYILAYPRFHWKINMN